LIGLLSHKIGYDLGFTEDKAIDIFAKNNYSIFDYWLFWQVA